MINVVEKIIPNFYWEPIKGKLTYGMKLTNKHLCSKIEENVDGVYVYNHSLNEVLDSGIRELKCEFIPTNLRYCDKGIIVTNKIEITKVKPTIVWEIDPKQCLRPNSIDYMDENEIPKAPIIGYKGIDSLSSKHCTAFVVEQIEGYWNYDPIIETKFGKAGEKVLKVSFIPVDLNNYEKVNHSITVHIWDRMNDLKVPRSPKKNWKLDLKEIETTDNR